MPNGKASANALPNGSQDRQAKQLINRQIPSCQTFLGSGSRCIITKGDRSKQYLLEEIV
jgi:hypothetical protein